MNISENEFQYMVETRTSDLVERLMLRKGLSMLDAFDKIYNSRTYAALANPKSGLYYQSPGYLYEILKEELSNPE